MIKVINVVGARPNFMKIAPLMRAYRKHQDRIKPLLVHTGQHYDDVMSKVFFDQLEIPYPDIDLEVGSGSHAEQTGRIMVGFEKLLDEEKPDLVVVVGDVNSTMACTITAAKAGIRTAHIEAGLRSFDLSMPEEINRKVTDAICDFLFTTEPSANDNLMREGVSDERIFFVGNVMIDTLCFYLERVRSMNLSIDGITEGKYATLTLHRPSNVDDPIVFSNILTAVEIIQEEVPIVFPVHPRTKKNIDVFGLARKCSHMQNLIMVEPIGYQEFLRLNITAKFAMTDSGGLQEETTYLGIPCLTIRDNTERPITIELGTNILTGAEPGKILEQFERIMNGSFKKGSRPQLWDGHASDRIASQLVRLMSAEKSELKKK
ncbi:MAG: non-hydrolyzing UDP-N-acetylglucosamine 2-epimerase [Syntrophales bacterium]